MAIRVEKSPRLETGRERDPLSSEEKLFAATALSAGLYAVTKGRGVELDTNRSLGTKDSAHDVFFVQTPQRNGAKRTAFACKRFRRLESAQKELHGMQEGRARGFQTLAAAGQGIFPIEEIGFVLVTQHVTRFTTMNYLGWRDAYAGQGDYERRIAQPMRRMGQFAAAIHSHGITHGDLQAKNIGQDLFGNSILFDLEDAVFADPQEVNEYDFISRAGDDLTVLMGSLVDRGFLWNSTDTIFRQELENNLINPYLDTIIEQGTIANLQIIEQAGHALGEALGQRPLRHNDFSSRMGLPS